MEPTKTAPEVTTSEQTVIESDSLVEEVSIDGMCGVY
ncbi:mycofactocin precursor [Microbacterium schleiferi]|uniref:Mycofactocin n=1 Tax=Microbacterium schleiferi TaxID=69362 RepID=A0A7S8MY20_9MICO|nr:mycofactocin precursor MftA [Microbacterium schleiferi]QPE04788.1 mycofactocin precursor [Microbacterium schleiferi]